MWILTGAFDTEDLSSQKSKLLKTGNTYPLGRKDQPLLIKSKKVSQLHCRFIVQESSLDDVHDPERRPTLTFYNERDKGIKLARGGGSAYMEAKSMSELQDGDVITLVSGVIIAVKWQTLCCYSPSLQGRSNISLETCCQLGISIVYTPNPHVSHHILPTYIGNASVATSLVSAAQFVRLEWLLEILRNADSLEENFVIPSLSKNRPSFSPSLNPSQKVFKVWEPNEERLNMFSEYRFLVFGEKTREIESDLRELIKRAGGFLETFDVAGGTAKLHRALTRGQAKEAQRLVVVADAKDMKAAIGQDEWGKLVAEVQSFELHITNPETVVQSVIDVDPSLLTACQPSSAGTNVLDSNLSMTSLPVCVPNSIPDEPSVAPEEPPARKRLLRRAASRQPSVEPTTGTVHEGANDESSKPRRLLLSRRGGTVEPIDGAAASNQPSSNHNAMPVAPTPGRLRLKRRLGTTPASKSLTTGVEAQSQLPNITLSVDDDEPPLKKFKALFDASDPTRAGAGSYDEDVVLNTNNEDLTTQTQSQTEGFVRRAATGSALAALREEEEEDSLVSGGQTQQGRKSALDSAQMEDQDVEMIVVENDGVPARKKQALESGNHVQKTTGIAPSTGKSPKSPRKEKERKPGAPLGKPDADVEFLKAVASTKKGKRAEDAFDREFNNLRISKPKAAEAERHRTGEEEEEWRKFVDFGDDAGLRGNFMVVLEMDVYQLKEGEQNQSDIQPGVTPRKDSVVPDQWKDQPNFKKFKKKILPNRRALVELFSNEDNDFDAAPTHWRNKKIQPERSASFPEMNAKTRNQLPRPGSRTKGPNIDDDDSGDNQPPEFGKRNALVNHAMWNKQKLPSRTVSQHAGSRLSSRASSVLLPKPTASKSSGHALFFDSDDDTEEVSERQTQSDFRGGNEDEDENEQTLRSSATTRRPMNALGPPRAATVTGRKRRAAAAGDDSDDGVVFRGFGAGRKRLKQ